MSETEGHADSNALMRERAEGSDEENRMEQERRESIGRSTGDKRQKVQGRAERQRRKKEKAEMRERGEWDRCLFIDQKANKFCNKQRAKGSTHCAYHRHLDGSSSVSLGIERVPCPLDPSHSVYRKALEKHLQICNREKERENIESQPYFRLNINSGKRKTGNGEEEQDDGLWRDTEKRASVSQAGRTEEKEDGSHGKGVSSSALTRMLERVPLEPFRQKVRRTFTSLIREESDGEGDDEGKEVEQHKEQIPNKAQRDEKKGKGKVGLFTQILDGPKGCRELLESAENAGSRHHTARHIIQQCSIVGHLERRGLLDPKFLYLELGAGRAMLSLALQAAAPEAKFLLIERASVRFKADRHILSGEFKRLKVDLRHLNLAGVSSLSLPTSPPIVAVSKHLCGVATDLALRCLLRTLPREDSRTPTQLHKESIKVESTGCDAVDETERRERKSRLRGICVATCCHHACNWDDYVGQRYLLELGFTPDEFALMTLVSSWATCGWERSQEEEHSVSPKMELGQQCKRLIDAGRARFLEDEGMAVEMVRYCSPEDSLENCLLLAWERS